MQDEKQAAADQLDKSEKYAHHPLLYLFTNEFITTEKNMLF
jgi:hypothetical protein